jgi:hypothetical protein
MVPRIGAHYQPLARQLVSGGRDHSNHERFAIADLHNLSRRHSQAEFTVGPKARAAQRPAKASFPLSLRSIGRVFPSLAAQTRRIFLIVAGLQNQALKTFCLRKSLPSNLLSATDRRLFLVEIVFRPILTGIFPSC